MKRAVAEREISVEKVVNWCTGVMPPMSDKMTKWKEEEHRGRKEGIVQENLYNSQ